MLNKNLKVLRKEKGISLEELAEKIGVSRQAVSKWESGDTTPDIYNCMSLANFFGITIDELVGIDELKKNNENQNNEKYLFGIAKVGERGQVVIPKKARDIYNISAGDSVIIVGDERGLAMAKCNDLTDFAENILNRKEET